MKLQLSLLILTLSIGVQSFSQQVTGVVMGTVFNYTALSESSHSFSFTTYFSIGSTDCPPFASAISFSDDTMFVTATYDICGFWPQQGCARNDVVPYNDVIPATIQHIVMLTNVITCQTGTPTLVENVYSRTYDVNLSTDTFVKNGLRIYPNPASSVLTVATNEPVVVDMIVVTDLLGKTLLEQYDSNSIVIESLPKGMYFIAAYSDGQKKVSQFVKD
ncbi:T9SS type A sorting domain-containing protein [Flavobacterium sp. XGLA_31]|uniref:T9SS type A sorting domain-containing protein n=1 Tax=Flavobacterium sp. XGLA_31 TaxID=3447666 RepID=UPI003F32AC39